MTELTKEKKEEFRELMANYKKGGGPFIMIDLNELFCEEYGEDAVTTSAGNLIKDAVRWEVQRAFAPKIKAACEGEATRYVYEFLQEQVALRFSDFFKNGFTKMVKNEETGELEEKPQMSVEEHMNSVFETWFTYQPTGQQTTPNSVQGHRRGEKGVTISSLHSHCQKLVTEYLDARAKEIIEDVNKEALETAKKSISKTVTDQLFEGMNLLPKIGGAKQD